MAHHDLSKAVHYHYGAFPPENLGYERLIDPLVEATAALARYDQMLASMHDGEILLAPLRNQEAVVSSRMEGTLSTLEEILRIEAEEDAGDAEAFSNARSEAVETFLYARAMRRIQREMSDGQPISEFMVRSAHQILLSYGRGASLEPGAYKSEQNYIGDSRRRSISFVPISPESLPAGMQSLIAFMHDDPRNSLLKTALAHVEFEALHPFKDGNGRIGRMLITLMLWDYRLIRAPHFYVSAAFEDMRDEYVERMRRVSSHGEWTEWCMFFLSALGEQARRNINTMSRIFALHEEMKGRFRDQLNSRWAMDAVDFMFTNPTFRNNRFTASSGIPPHVAMDITRKLRDAGLLVQVAPGAGRRPAMYAFQPLIDIVRE
ncbi:Fic family protein [uncultured Amaricoccus sp.]|uniref:Fic family protein n=1 Tax=uncultured Amaricoccus sp. TaxID=339341 RepID=UPI00260A6F36|nr:Fic family protein [uncultured Amaricoccus sp.]